MGSMKQFTVIACLLPLALSEPHGYGYGNYKSYGTVAVAPKCVTQYDNVAETQCTDVPEKICNTEIVTNTKTVPDKKCTTDQKEECVTSSKLVAEQKCLNTEVEVCDTVVRQVPEKKCENVVEKKCNPVEECTTEKKCEDVETCTNVIKNECTKTTKTTTEQQCTSEQRCTTEQQCTTETQTVADTYLEDVCTPVSTQVCDQVQTSVQYAPAPVATVAAAPIATVASAPLVAAPAATLAPTPAVGAPIPLGPSPLFSAGVLPGPLGKRDADAEADPQLLSISPIGTPVATIAGAPPCCSFCPSCVIHPRLQDSHPLPVHQGVKAYHSCHHCPQVYRCSKMCVSTQV